MVVTKAAFDVNKIGRKEGGRVQAAGSRYRNKGRVILSMHWRCCHQELSLATVREIRTAQALRKAESPE